MNSRQGLLSKEYIGDRKRKSEFKFRLSVRAQIAAEAIHKYFTKSSKLNILDLGAAEGLTVMKLSALLPENQFIGIEYSQELIDLSIPLSGNVELIRGDASKLPDAVKKGHFDVVIALAILEHLTMPSKAVQETFRVLRPGGLFVITCPEPVWDRISSKLGLLKNDQHETKMRKTFLKNIILDAGFNLLEYRRFMWAPISFLPYLHIPISPYYSIKLDRWIDKVKVLNWLFVNQVVICQKPEDKHS